MKISLSQLRAQGDQLRAAREHLAAIRVYLAILKRIPEDYETRIHLADALERSEAVNEALKVYEAVAKHCINCGRPLVAIVACRAMEARGKRTEHLLLQLSSHYGSTQDRKPTVTGGHRKVYQEETLIDAKELRKECTVPELLKEAAEEGADLKGIDEAPFKFFSIPLLSELSPARLVKVIRTILVHRVPPGHVIFSQGQPGKSCFLLARGAVRVKVRQADGNEVEVASLADGAIFGEMTLITGSNRSATVEATEQTDLLEIGPDALAAIGDELDRIASALDRLAQKRWLANLMRQSPIFAAFNEEERRELLKHFQAHEIPEGMMLLEQGKLAPGIYLLLRGEVQLVHREERESARITSQVGPGTTLGLDTVLKDEPSTVKATTLTPATVLYLPLDSVRRLVEAVPEFAKAIRDAAPPL